MTSRIANSAVSTVYVYRRLMASFATFGRQRLVLGIQRLIKPEQEEAITQFLMGRDVFVALPTGYGKSLDDIIWWLADNLPAADFG